MKKVSTKVELPAITFNYGFKSKKEARMEALKALMSSIIHGDKEIEKEMKVKVTKS